MSSSYSLLRVFTVTLLRLNIELSTEPDASEVLFNSSKALSMKRSCCCWRRESVSAIKVFDAVGRAWALAAKHVKVGDMATGDWLILGSGHACLILW